jgi:hypothetical protein
MEVDPAETLLFHITAFANIPSIVSAKGLHCLASMAKKGTKHSSIAFESVQARRARTRVTCGPGGCLHDYVPFYFAPRSPMLYAIHKGQVSCENGQDGLACIVSSAGIVETAGLQYAFTDGHGIMAPLTNFYDDLSDLGKIDWDVMRAHYWRDTADDPDRKRRRQAEFLIHDFFPIKCVVGIAVNKVSTVAKVRNLLGGLSESIQVKAKSDYFY